MSKEEELKSARRVIKSSLTRILNYAKDCANEEVEQLSIRNEKIEELWAKYDEIQSQLELLNQEHEGDRECFETTYYRAKGMLKKYLSLNQSKELDSCQVSQSKVLANSSFSIDIKLPRINMPFFSGEYQEWQSFYDVFDSLVHSNSELSKIQKFHYLKSQLKGEATKVIDSLGVSSDNYDEAWSLLIERYNNKQFIVHMHIKSLFEIPVIHKDSVSGLRTLINESKQHLRSLKSMGIKTENWDDIIIYLLLQKLDIQCRRDWELSKDPDVQKLSTLEEFHKFLEKRCLSLEACLNTSNQEKSRHLKIGSFASERGICNVKCKLCNKMHHLYNCDVFLAQNVTERCNTVKDLGVCFNCLRGSHNVLKCRSSFRCVICRRKHHTLIHLNNRSAVENTSVLNNQQEQQPKSPTVEAEAPITRNQSLTLQKLTGPSEILLATVSVLVKDNNGVWLTCRALLDGGSQSNFVTSKLIKKLNLPSNQTNIPIGGIGQSYAEVNSTTVIEIASRVSQYKTILEFLVLEKITSELPTVKVNIQNWNIPAEKYLADPNFNIPNEIDMLLGAEIFLKVLKQPKILNGSGDIPVLQNTEFGYILSGKVQHCYAGLLKPKKCFVGVDELHDQIQRFWDIEEKCQDTIFSQEELLCEEHFRNNTTRHSDGRYSVRLPFKCSPVLLGDSYSTALSRFSYLEKRFGRNAVYKEKYKEFIEEYLKLGHMEEVVNDNAREGYYMPHHAILKESNISTKIRVVFDASAASSTGVSLNEIQMVGPRIQDSLFEIILRFRTHQYVITADIEKMYRQIEVHPDDRKYQKILWRANELEELKTYQLKTVTYGTSSAPFLSVRCLHKLADDEGDNFAVASEVLKRDFYVDDLITGGSSIDETRLLRDQMHALLKSGGFNLRKWSSNDVRLLKDMENISGDPIQLLDSSQPIKMLGLYWDAHFDGLSYKFESGNNNQHLTKRILLSQITKLFDPLGLLGPITCRSKILIQQLWQTNLGWDEVVPDDIAKVWYIITCELKLLSELKIPRKVVIENAEDCQLHGFCDASEAAYGACIFIRTKNAVSSETYLLCSKSRVAPLKKVTLPRLELCAAQLLANLLQSILPVISLKISKVILWSDSTITLTWIKTPAHKLKTFISNRVADIQKLTDSGSWKWINTKHNPADILSRGCSPKQLIELSTWWKGPKWISQDEQLWPCEQPVQEISESELELKPTKLVCNLAMTTNDLFLKFSNLLKLQRITAYCLRFIKRPKFNDNVSPITGPLTVEELEYAKAALIKRSQLEDFNEEVICLSQQKEIKSSSKLICLNPFLDEDGLLRVGGRIRNSMLNFNEKHQIILPEKHPLTKMIVTYEHIKTLHLGTQALLNHLRQTYWPINGRNLVKRVIYQCYKCFRGRLNHQINNQFMGDLPRCRFNTLRPFINVGVDYGGPILIKANKLRKSAIVKSYIALFICMSTKAIHLELVSGLSTNDFMAALRRFVSRRGRPVNIYSDNATNFHGANNEMQELRHYFQNKLNQSNIQEAASTEFIQWHFIPPSSPHFGGLWEANIKSVKSHIKRNIGETKLTFEEMYTLLTQIESCVNSRPLTPIFDDPNDCSALTPAHFLIGAPMTLISEKRLTDVNINRLTRWQLIQQMLQHFWDRWSREYLQHLQERKKWFKSIPNLQPDDLVVLRQDHSPPASWKLARVEAVHPGQDGRVRVATIRSGDGVFKRAVCKLAPLPKEN